VPCVHLDRDRGARGKARREQLLRVWTFVVPALVDRLVDRQLVLADRDPVDEVLACAVCGCLDRWIVNGQA
jgi:hypothetical protein